MSTAFEADKAAADSQFLLRIKEFALADAKNLAAPHISQKLRSEKFVREWGKALGALCTEVRDKATQRLIQDRRVEAAALKKRMIVVNQSDTESLSQYVTKRLDMDVAGRSLHEIEIILLVEILREVRAKAAKGDAK